MLTAVAAVLLSSGSRDQVGTVIELLIERLDALDGDPDSEPLFDDEPSDDLEPIEGDHRSADLALAWRAIAYRATVNTLPLRHVTMAMLIAGDQGGVA